MCIMNFVIDQNFNLTQSLSILDTVSVGTQFYGIKINYTNEYISECMSKLSQCNYCVCTCDNTLILGSLKNTKIGIWIN